MSSPRMPAAQRRRQLLEVALGVFGGRGYHETSMNELASAAGVTKPVLYRHFDSKHDLYAQVLDWVGDELWQRVSTATAAASGPRAQVDGGFRAFFRFFAESPAAFHVLFGDGVRADATFARSVDRLEQRIAENVADLIAIEGLAHEDRMLLAAGIVGLAEGAARQLMRDPDADPARVAALVVELAWAGLRGS